MRITIEVNSDEEYKLAFEKYMPMLGELSNSTVEIIKLDDVEDRTLDMMMMMDLQSVVRYPVTLSKLEELSNHPDFCNPFR